MNSSNNFPHILLRSSWQTVNIGDIGHTPGLLRLIETHFPQAQITLWPCNIGNGVREILLKAFPQVQIVEGLLDDTGQPATPELSKVWEECDFLLHGSGPSVVRSKDLSAWKRDTAKPYGIYGVTIDTMDDEMRDLLRGASFVYCRDSVSLDFIQKNNALAPVSEFAPDATFAIALRDEERATNYLRDAGLEKGRFICAIPRLRYSPYHEIHQTEATPEDLRRAAVSAQWREIDHSKLREAMTIFVRQTGIKVLACPEMIHEVKVAKESLVDLLPDDVKPFVVWRDSYWLPDEAASVYARALAVVSFEMHSPIIAAAMDTPAIHLRQPTDTCKGQMWRDIGLSDWMFEIEETNGDEIASRLLEIVTALDASRAKLKAAMEFVGARQSASMAVFGQVAGCNF